jgi:molybdenum cofactor synthesis domain-containing protein
MADRILGLYNIKEREWDKMAYLHNNARGGICVDGAPSGVVLHRAGSSFSAGADYAIIVPRAFHYVHERFVAVEDGACLLWMDEHGEISVRRSGFVGVSDNIEALREINAGVLTISDKASRGERVDTAGPALADMTESLGSAVRFKGVVQDDRNEIARKITEWADGGKLQLILTTGGTGVSVRDVTPEALMDIHEKVVPGFGEIMRNRSMLYTPRGLLTRSVAITRKNVLIIAFPGSERAVRQCFEAVAPSIRHAVEMLDGWNSECGAHAGIGRKGEP